MKRFLPNEQHNDRRKQPRYTPQDLQRNDFGGGSYPPQFNGSPFPPFTPFAPFTPGPGAGPPPPPPPASAMGMASGPSMSPDNRQQFQRQDRQQYRNNKNDNNNNNGGRWQKNYQNNKNNNNNNHGYNNNNNKNNNNKKNKNKNKNNQGYYNNNNNSQDGYNNYNNQGYYNNYSNRGYDNQGYDNNQGYYDNNQGYYNNNRSFDNDKPNNDAFDSSNFAGNSSFGYNNSFDHNSSFDFNNSFDHSNNSGYSNRSGYNNSGYNNNNQNKNNNNQNKNNNNKNNKWNKNKNKNKNNNNNQNNNNQNQNRNRSNTNNSNNFNTPNFNNNNNNFDTPGTPAFNPNNPPAVVEEFADAVDMHIDNVIKSDLEFNADKRDMRSSMPSTFSPMTVNRTPDPQPSTSRQPMFDQSESIASSTPNRWELNQMRAKAQAQAEAMAEAHSKAQAEAAAQAAAQPAASTQPESQAQQESQKPRSPSVKKSPKEEDEDVPIVPGWHNLPRFDIKTVEDSAFDIPETVTDFYDRIGQVGEGTYGKVYKARNRVSKLHVALKRIRMEQEKDGFPVTALREIKLLQQSHHDNVVRLHEMLVSKGSVYMVFEYIENDLTGLLQHGPDLFQVQHKKSLCQQMLAGLSYLHHRGILHRDMKGSNILISNKGVLKLADFGLARFYHKHRKADYTNRVITIWYRPPELLLGATSYGPEVDMWSAGCIMLEIYTTKPVFQGDNEVHQLEIIFKMLGAPSLQDWPGFSDLPWYELVRPTGKHSSERFRDTFKRWLTPAGLELAQALLTFDPTKRITAHDALKLPFFQTEEPRPQLPDHLGELQGEWHEFEAKREKAQAKLKLKEEKEENDEAEVDSQVKVKEEVVEPAVKMEPRA